MTDYQRRMLGMVESQWRLATMTSRPGNGLTTFQFAAVKTKYTVMMTKTSGGVVDECHRLLFATGLSSGKMQ